MYKYECLDCHCLITEDDLKEMGEFLCPNCGSPNLRELLGDQQPVLVPA
ncbi:unnamed protein product [marine sediment metagenome]|uniref:Uncharacterized protein n=1 Tax=marine sediment metagenome TaxID=412755 RepID=X1HLX8_9ZZZZ